MKKIRKTVSRFRKKKGLLWRFARREAFFLSFNGLMSLIVATILIWIIYGISISLFPAEMETRGQAGDMFGGLTALFSGLAFAGLVYTLFVQKKELQYQREELARLVEEQAQTGKYLKGQTDQLELQSSFIEKQIFESNFFQLLSSFSEFVSRTTKYRKPIEYKGADALEIVSGQILSNIKGLGKSEKDFLLGYATIFPKHKNDLSPYFRQIYTILKFIDQSKIKNKRFYSNILRAQFSGAELTLLAMNGASDYGREKMAPLMKEYEILKHFDEWDLFETANLDDHLRTFYSDWDFYRQKSKNT